MIERRPALVVLRHVVLIAGVGHRNVSDLCRFVASTLSLDQVLTVPMQLGRAPSDRELLRRCSRTAASGVRRTGRAMMFNSLVMALVIAIGKISISDDLRFRHRLFQVPAAKDVLLDDLRDPHAAGRGADLPDLQGRWT